MSAITREQLLSLHEQTAAKAREVMTKKNHDYAAESDVFRNFRYFGGLGILVRLSDKLSRLRSFEENGQFKVTDENLEDTIIDAINYAVIYLAFKRETTEPPPPASPKVVTLTMPAPVVLGPYCENCDKLATFRHCSDTYWCDECRGGSPYWEFTRMAPVGGTHKEELRRIQNKRDGI